MIREFRDFLLRGNLVDLAVAVVIGLAFAALVTSLVEDLITPLIAAIGGQPDFSGITFEINNSILRIGEFINAVISFLIIATVVFFLVVVPMNRLLARVNPTPPETPMRECPHCLSQIQAAATRCAYCTQEVPAETQTG